MTCEAERATAGQCITIEHNAGIIGECTQQ